MSAGPFPDRARAYRAYRAYRAIDLTFQGGATSFRPKYGTWGDSPWVSSQVLHVPEHMKFIL